ncbi:hypothetical protein Taro_017679 [Colocasia esculenta]|uniref:Uncharacterized protein n=1 Tax=Colocasia esculenta TaxID=4460 RepID=A0A843UGT1_COLES|nr:hypothetical protein [Colocasia esculenta]
MSCRAQQGQHRVLRRPHRCPAVPITVSSVGRKSASSLSCRAALSSYACGGASGTEGPSTSRSKIMRFDPSGATDYQDSIKI